MDHSHSRLQAIILYLLLLPFMATVVIFPFAYADSDIVAGTAIEKNGISYVVREDGTLSVTGVNLPKNKRITIPKEVAGFKVSTLASMAFSALSDVSAKTAPDVIISEGVERADENAFSSTMIRTLSIPSTLTRFEANSFRDQIAQIKVSPKNPVLGVKNGFLFGKTNGIMYWYPSVSNGKKAVIIPEEITQIIGDISFFPMQSLEKITLSSNLRVASFAHCENREKPLTIIIPKGMTILPEEMAAASSSDEEGNQRFSIYTEADVILVDKGNQTFESKDGFLIDKTKGELIYCSKNADAEEIVIPEGVSIIKAGTFRGFEKVKSVSLPDSLQSIDESAFAECKNLERIEIPKSVTRIAPKAFSSCSGLRGIVLPEGLEKIAEEAFYDCAELNSVIIPTSVTAIDSKAFDQCVLLDSVAIPDNVTEIQENAFYSKTDVRAREKTVSARTLAKTKDIKYTLIPKDKYKVSIRLAFKEYKYNSRIHVFLDKNELGLASSKEDFSLSVDVEEGRHTLWLYLDDKSEGLSFDISADTSIFCNVAVKSSFFSVLNITSYSPNTAKLVVGKGKSKCWYCDKCGQLTDMLFTSCVDCGNQMSDVSIQLLLDFKGNLIFSRYGVKVYVDDVHYVDLEHGKKEELECRLIPGKHKLRLQKMDDPNIFSETDIDVKSDALITIKFETNKSGIKITDSQTSSYTQKEYVIKFSKSEMHREYHIVFFPYLHSVRLTSIYKTIKGKRDTNTSFGSYVIDKNGFITLLVNGVKTKLFYDVVFDELDPHEALFFVGENGVVNRNGELGRDYYERVD